MRSAAALLALAALLAPGASFAEDAESLIKKGVELRKKGKDAQALELFKQALEISKAPKALAQMGLAQQALGLWVEAESSLSAALASKDPWIKERKATLETALGDVRSRVGGLEVIGPAGAEVRINGEARGTLPLAAPLRLAAGSVTLEVHLEGHYPISRSVGIPGGGLARETAKLAPKEIAAVPTPAPAPAEPRPSPPPEEAKAAPPAAPMAATARVEKGSGGPWGWVAAGGAAAGLAVGIIGVVLQNGHASTWNGPDCLPANGATREETCAGERSAAETAGGVATAGFVVGGVGAAAAAAWFLFLAPSDEEAVALTSYGELGLAVRGRF